MEDTGDESQGGPEGGGTPDGGDRKTGEEGAGWWSLVPESDATDAAERLDETEQTSMEGTDWLAPLVAREQPEGDAAAQEGAGSEQPGWQPTGRDPTGRTKLVHGQPGESVLVPEPELLGEEPEVPPVKRRLPQRPTLLALGLLVLSVVALFFSIRYAYAKQEVFDPSAFAPASNSELIASGNEAEPSMVDLPDVVGLERERAITVLQEAGLDDVAMEIVEIEWAAPAGVVVQQDPAPGTNDPESVTLSVSVASTTPNLVGMAEDAATEALRSLGASVEVEYRYQAGVTVGSVLGQSVEAGAVLPAAVDLVVAGQGATVKLGMLEEVDSDCGSGREESVNGQVFPNSVVCSLSTNSDDIGSATYLLSHKFEQFVATVGVSDTSLEGVPVTFRVLVDGSPVYTGTLSLGASEVVSVAVTDGLRLTLEASTSGASEDYQSVEGVFGDPSLLTSPEIARQYEEP